MPGGAVSPVIEKTRLHVWRVKNPPVSVYIYMEQWNIHIESQKKQNRINKLDAKRSVPAKWNMAEHAEHDLPLHRSDPIGKLPAGAAASAAATTIINYHDAQKILGEKKPRTGRGWVGGAGLV